MTCELRPILKFPSISQPSTESGHEIRLFVKYGQNQRTLVFPF